MEITMAVVMLVEQYQSIPKLTIFLDGINHQHMGGNNYGSRDMEIPGISG